MFIGMSKTLARMGAFRIGAGIRITKKNAIYILFVLFFVYMAQFTWYMLVGIGWLIYGMFYLCYLPFKLMGKRKNTNESKHTSPSRALINNAGGEALMKKPLYKRWYVWVVGFVIFSFIVSPFLPEKEPTTPPEAEAMAVISETPEPTEEPVTEATPEPTEEPTPQPTVEPTTQPTPEPTTQPTPEPTTQSTIEPTAEATPKPTEEPAPLESAVMVWLSATGTKYHSINDCSGMNPDKARQLTLEEVKSRNYAPCENCNPPQ